jgi:hypothetical protein
VDCPHCPRSSYGVAADAYFCLKRRAGLLHGVPGQRSPDLLDLSPPHDGELTPEERMFIGLGVSSVEDSDGWSPITAAFRSHERQSTVDATRLAGLRALIDIGGDELEL